MNREQPFNVGDAVQIHSLLGGRLGGKTFTVTEIYEHTNCSTGWVFKLKEYDRPLDSDWAVQVNGVKRQDNNTFNGTL